MQAAQRQAQRQRRLGGLGGLFRWLRAQDSAAPKCQQLTELSATAPARSASQDCQRDCPQRVCRLLWSLTAIVIVTASESVESAPGKPRCLVVVVRLVVRAVARLVSRLRRRGRRTHTLRGTRTTRRAAAQPIGGVAQCETREERETWEERETCDDAVTQSASSACAGLRGRTSGLSLVGAREFNSD